MRVHQIAARLRTLLEEEGDFATVLRGAGLVVIIRVLASAVGFASVILLARWMGSSQYGFYSFAIACMTLLAYPATLGLPGAAVRFVAQYAAADDWQHVAGFMKMSSWLAFGCGALIATLAIGALLLFNFHLDPGYVAPTIVALAGIPIVAPALVRSEAVRGLGWLALAWGPLQLGQPPRRRAASLRSTRRAATLPSRPTPRAASKPTLKPRRARGHAQAVRDLAEGVRCGVLSWRPWPALGSGGRPDLDRADRKHDRRRQAGRRRVPCARRAAACQIIQRQAARPGQVGHGFCQHRGRGRGLDQSRALPGRGHAEEQGRRLFQGRGLGIPTSSPTDF